MSYSFSVKGRDKLKVKRQIADEFENVVKGQPTHNADRDAAVACAQSFVDLLVDPEDGKHIHVSVNGSLGWRGQTAGREIESASISVNASIRADS